MVHSRLHEQLFSWVSHCRADETQSMNLDATLMPNPVIRIQNGEVLYLVDGEACVRVAPCRKVLGPASPDSEGSVQDLANWKKVLFPHNRYRRCSL